MKIYIENSLWDSFSFFEEIRKLFKFPVEFSPYVFKDPYFLAYIKVRNPNKREFYEPFPIEVENEKKGLIKGVIYDGVELLKYFSRDVDTPEPTVLITKRLIATFGEDGRYHLRMIVMGPAAIISLKGILYAPAKSPQYYIMHSFGFEEKIDVDVGKVLKMLLLQFYAYFKHEEIFCESEECMLHNCHTMEEIKRVKGLCGRHGKMFGDSVNLRGLSF
ncbi:DUF6775 family putative metallopeptidase [Thermococcus sp. JdF3]|uniref:DUF6775 family putative metallopeptidase n=1 Tax=Thermococcus sp. JdF3 TaxID=1638258 RepID=UPI00143C553B|nr:DUF6775 family putative metallopeptidase [Thermococcus sp. JdF3]NJE00906.1 hypothetical protein [Thermococcus sp. JdF3]